MLPGASTTGFPDFARGPISPRRRCLSPLVSAQKHPTTSWKTPILRQRLRVLLSNYADDSEDAATALIADPAYVGLHRLSEDLRQGSAGVHKAGPGESMVTVN